MLNDTLNFLTWAAICACLWLVPLPSHAASSMPTHADFERAALVTFAAGVILTIAAFAKFWRRS